MRDILKLVASGCAILTFFMSVLHIMLSIGLPIGEYVLGGKNKIIPKEKRYINVMLAFAFWFLGVFYIGKAVPIPFQFSDIMSKIIMILYLLFLAYAVIGNTFFTKIKYQY